MFFKGGEGKSAYSQGVLCILGGFLLCLSFASDFSYPNLNTYIISYMRQNGENAGLSYADFVLLTSTKVILQGSSMPFIGYLARRVGIKPSIAIGSIIYSSGFLLTYWTIKMKFIMAIMTMSLHGIGFSWVYATAISAAQACFPARMKGRVGSLVVSGYGFGSLVWIPLQTAFVNPKNVKAVIDRNCEYFGTEHQERSCDRYFEDPELLERIPYMFLVLGSIFLGMGMISVILISDARKDGKLIQDEISEEAISPDDLAKTPLNAEKQDPVYLKPTEALRTPIFYQIWIAFFSLCITNGLMGNYSKTYGLTFINDDHFFAWVGIIANIFNGAGRIVWGIVYDKLNFKRTYLIMAVIVGTVTACLPVLPYLDAPIIVLKVCYGFLMVSLYGSFPGIYAIVAAAVSDAFGQKYYQANFGLLFSNAVAYCLLIILFTKVAAIYGFLGYTGMFLVAAGIALLGIFTAFFLPTRLKCEDTLKKIVCSSSNVANV